MSEEKNSWMEGLSALLGGNTPPNPGAPGQKEKANEDLYSGKINWAKNQANPWMAGLSGKDLESAKRCRPATAEELSAVSKRLDELENSIPKTTEVKTELGRTRKELESAVGKLKIAQEAAGLTLKEALAQFGKLELPGVTPKAKAAILQTVQVYSQHNSVRKTAGSLKCSTTTVHNRLKEFEKHTGIKVIHFERHQSVRSHLEIRNAETFHLPEEDSESPEDT
jgi:methylphosphotriester-DNA--protein-cysteine methyltransferase